jgi:hypothetical protein
VAINNITNVPLILKELWLDGIEDFQYDGKPFYGMVGKDTSWSGLKLHVTVSYANGTSIATNFDDAKAGKDVSKYAAMEVETSDLFALWSVDNKLITLTRDQKGSLVRALSEATEKAQTKFKRRTAWMLWGNGGGAAGKVSAVTATDLTLANPNDVRNFDVGDRIETSTDDGRAGAGVIAGTQAKITAIDEDTGKLTLDTDITAAAAAGQFVFQKGDYAAVVKGVGAYVCAEKPGTGSEPAAIWGMTRTAFPTRLGGHRFTPSSPTLTVVEAIKEALMNAHRRSCGVTHIFTSPEIFNEVEMTLEANRRYIDEKVGRVGFTGLEFSSQSGKVCKLFSDPDIRKRDADAAEMIYGLNLDKWTFHTAEEWPMWLTADGDKRFMTEENTNSREGRLGGYGNLYTRSPGDNFVLAIAP